MYCFSLYFYSYFIIFFYFIYVYKHQNLWETEHILSNSFPNTVFSVISKKKSIHFCVAFRNDTSIFVLHSHFLYHLKHLTPFNIVKCFSNVYEARLHQAPSHFSNLFFIMSLGTSIASLVPLPFVKLKWCSVRNSSMCLSNQSITMLFTIIEVWIIRLIIRYCSHLFA